jgi:hypothetical protein
MKLMYVLTMPGVASWNGKWSGEGNLYAKIERYGDSKAARERVAKILAGSPYHYRWSDGWAAMVAVSEPTAAESRQARKRSKGFCGYDWMIDSIDRDQRILATHERAPADGARSSEGTS